MDARRPCRVRAANDQQNRKKQKFKLFFKVETDVFFHHRSTQQCFSTHFMPPSRKTNPSSPSLLRVSPCFVYLCSKTSVTHLVVFLLCQQVVESLVDGLVVVTLDRSQVGLDQLQLVHLVDSEQKVTANPSVYCRADGGGASRLLLPC